MQLSIMDTTMLLTLTQATQALGWPLVFTSVGLYLCPCLREEVANVFFSCSCFFFTLDFTCINFPKDTRHPHGFYPPIILEGLHAVFLGELYTSWRTLVKMACSGGP